ncbi:5969_t:CDS:2 [Paraglomus occultum]|uniref:Elongin-C n=1 Tax=Paraglomus occultum TaxID=144539 RepID=A0A9N9A9A1_9GLOM|nr:5969_t:CDS:2 [Paraglomus occultum]
MAHAPPASIFTDSDKLNKETMNETESGRPEYVKLVSADGFTFIVEKNAAIISQTLKNMLSNPAQLIESEQNEIYFRAIKAKILEHVCRYMYYNVRYKDASTETPEFALEPELAYEVFMAADFLRV